MNDAMRMIQDRAAPTVKRNNGASGQDSSLGRQMAKAATPPRPTARPAGRFRREIEAALAGGLEADDQILRLTLRDAQLLARDPKVPLADISYAAGVMRVLGVRVENKGVANSTLDRGAL